MQGAMGYILAGCGLVGFHDDFGALALARTENDGGLCAGRCRGRATTVRVMLKAEFAPAQFRPEKKAGSRRDQAQGCNFLPIHNVNIAFYGVGANGSFLGVSDCPPAPRPEREDGPS
jgi:hypothetical protein